jgi:8-oxo-dGTP pyrophosphatase MutT (NUDIX family)
VATVGVVEHLHIAPTAGAPMQSVTEARALKGVGLAGDRYAAAAGYWGDGKVSRDLTLIEAETVEDLERSHGIRLEPGATRRNVTTRGVDLNSLLSGFFWVGDALCQGTHLCEPCRHLEEVTGRSLLRPLVRRGGLRARLLGAARVSVGDPVEPVEPQPGVGVVVARDSRVLLGRRLSAHGYGTWSFPGGKPLPGETVQQCAVRELREETGIVASAPRMIGLTVDGFPRSRDVFRTTFVQIDGSAANPVAAEPEKTVQWEWFGWDELPEPLFTPVASLVATGYTPSGG